MIIAKIHNVFKSLTDTEKKIASYILKNPEKVIDMTAKELAEKCGTVPSAVMRMCKSIGVDGFSKLKISLAGTMSDGEEFSCDGSDCENAFGKVFNSGISTLKNTYKMLDFLSIEKMVSKIISADRIFIFGVGTSSVIAVDMAYRLSQLGICAYAYTDILQMGVMAMNMKKKDVAFGISHSGDTKTVVDAMRLAKKAGAETMALTSFSKSLLYTESDWAISVYADEENYPVEAVSARIAHMCVADALIMAASKNSKALEEHILMRNEILDSMRYKKGVKK